MERESGGNGIGGWSTKTWEQAQKDLMDNWMQHEGQGGGIGVKTCTGQAYKVCQPFSFIIYHFTNINPTSSTLPTSPPTSTLVPTTRPPGGLVLAKPTTPLSLSPLLGHLGGSILKHELSHPCKHKGGGARVCKNNHSRPCSCKRKLPCPHVVFHSTQTGWERDNPLSVVFQYTMWMTQCSLHHQMWQCQHKHRPSLQNPLHIEQHALLARCFRCDEGFNLYFIY